MRTLALLLLLSSSVFGQLEVTVTKVKALDGIVGPRVYDSLILLDAASSPKVVDAALIKVISPSKFIKVKARKSLFETSNVTKLSETEYAFTGSGRYAVEVTSFDPNLGIDERVVEVTFGPDKPDEPDIPDDGPFDNLAGRVAIWSSGLSKNKELADCYEQGALKLVNDPLATVNSVSSSIIECRTRVLQNVSGDYQKLITELNNDLKSRWEQAPFSKGVLSEWYSEVVKGLRK